MPDGQSQSLKTLDKDAAKEGLSADRSYDFKSHRENLVHRERIAKIKQEGRKDTLLIVSFSFIIVILILCLIATTTIMPMFYPSLPQNMAIVPSILFMIGNLMGYVFGRGIK